jgi:hypothetical protein
MQTQEISKLIKIYDFLKTYPIQNEPIRYPKSIMDQENRRDISSMNDLLVTNMMALVPNIDIGIHKNSYSENDLTKWIQMTKLYFNNLNILVQKKCDNEMQKLKGIEDLKIKTKVLDLNKVDQLPEDIIRYIYGFLTPESRMDILLCKYPNYITDLQQLTNNHLKIYLRSGIYENYIRPIYSYTSINRHRAKCLQKEIRIAITFTNKKNYTDQIQMVFDEYKRAIPRTPDDNFYFKSGALRLLQSIIYIGQYKGNTLRRNKKTIAVPIPPSVADPSVADPSVAQQNEVGPNVVVIDEP